MASYGYSAPLYPALEMRMVLASLVRKTSWQRKSLGRRQVPRLNRRVPWTMNPRPCATAPSLHRLAGRLPFARPRPGFRCIGHLRVLCCRRSPQKFASAKLASAEIGLSEDIDPCASRESPVPSVRNECPGTTHFFEQELSRTWGGNRGITSRFRPVAQGKTPIAPRNRTRTMHLTVGHTT
jgi:hypothetical protein